MLEEVLDKHLPNGQGQSAKVGLPNTKHRSEDAGGNRVEHPVPLAVKYKITQQQDQNQKKKPKKIGLWLLARKASKDGQRVDMDAKHKNQVPSSAREGRQVQSADPGALMYLPLGGSKSVR